MYATLYIIADVLANANKESHNTAYLYLEWNPPPLEPGSLALLRGGHNSRVIQATPTQEAR